MDLLHSLVKEVSLVSQKKTPKDTSQKDGETERFGPAEDKFT